MESLDILGHFLDRLVRLLSKKFLIPFERGPKRQGLHITEARLLFVKEPPDPIEEAGRPLHALVIPIEISLRWRGKEAEHPRRISTVLIDQVLGIDDILL